MSVAPVSALCLLFLLSVCTACYISNCPIGGKRAALDFPSRKCMSCGPGDMGCCFGPSICCGEGMGCYMGSPEAASCVEENYLTYPFFACNCLCNGLCSETNASLLHVSSQLGSQVFPIPKHTR
uniref:Oxytocin n=1 Tax=Oncorhynchus mykiss TaxID=8022 RepID=A0A8C7SI31_ONCMY